MSTLLKRQLNSDEKAVVLRRHGRAWFANGHEGPEGEAMHFDHIHAYSSGGETSLNNIAPMFANHNLEKGKLSLEDFRVKLRMQKFFSTGQNLTLKDLLHFMTS